MDPIETGSNETGRGTDLRSRQQPSTGAVRPTRDILLYLRYKRRESSLVAELVE